MNPGQQDLRLSEQFRTKRLKFRYPRARASASGKGPLTSVLLASSTRLYTSTLSPLAKRARREVRVVGRKQGPTKFEV